MLASLVATLTHWFAPWNNLYANSKVVETSVTSLHLLAMMVGGGIAISADRDTLRAARSPGGMGSDVLRRLHASHRPVLIALSVLFLSGLALATADIETFAKSPVFLIKLGFVALLTINGGVLVLTENRLRRDGDTPRLWRRLQRSTVFSLALWLCTVIAGAALVNAG